MNERKHLQLNDFNCLNCGLPWASGEFCMHCRINPERRTMRQPPSSVAHYAIITAIGLISVAVLLYGFWMAAR